MRAVARSREGPPPGRQRAACLVNPANERATGGRTRQGCGDGGGRSSAAARRAGAPRHARPPPRAAPCSATPAKTAAAPAAAPNGSESSASASGRPEYTAKAQAADMSTAPVAASGLAPGGGSACKSGLVCVIRQGLCGTCGCVHVAAVWEARAWRRGRNPAPTPLVSLPSGPARAPSPCSRPPAAARPVRSAPGAAPRRQPARRRLLGGTGSLQGRRKGGRRVSGGCQGLSVGACKLCWQPAASRRGGGPEGACWQVLGAWRRRGLERLRRQCV